MILPPTTAQSVYQSQSMTLPQSVGTFIWYIVDEAHEDAVTERHKYISDHNPIYLPMNLVIHQGTALSFLDADAPWDTPHPHTINIMDSSNNIVYTTGKLDYTNSSTAKVLPIGQYTIQDTKYPWMNGKLTVVSNPQKSVGNLIMGGFYTPTNQVANNKDNDGGTHPDGLDITKNSLQKMDLKSCTHLIFIILHVSIVREVFGLTRKQEITHSSFIVQTNHWSKLLTSLGNWYGRMFTYD
jgi:hypothetical protein